MIKIAEIADHVSRARVAQAGRLLFLAHTEKGEIEPGRSAHIPDGITQVDHLAEACLSISRLRPGERDLDNLSSRNGIVRERR